ncbi:GNAT family N-acetyltransferase [Streptomyces sp. V3I8]|uniref:GNAT family N-acetyltransferase n=1 Tax=Streptomyces sp. V3I8 TaxID=3042279 RepID=UPI0027D79CBD|nr:hypothetical protein [Streptomyces sp. V3I8]
MPTRRETPVDVPAARAVIAAAFAGPDTPGPRDPVEATLLDALRTCGGWLPELSFVAVQEKAGGKANGKTGEKTGEEAGEKTGEEEVTGHVVCTRGHADGVPALALGLGPIGVRPDHQRHGTGLALMHAVLGAAGAPGRTARRPARQPRLLRPLRTVSGLAPSWASCRPTPPGARTSRSAP